MRRARVPRQLNGILDSLRGITQALRLSSSVVQDKLGITGAQLFVLQQLAEQPVSSLRELQARTFTDQSSVSVVVSRLVESGYVTRRRSKVDARRLELAVTISGRALLRRAPPLAQTQLVATLCSVGVRELDVTASVLERVAHEMGERPRKPQMFFEPLDRPAARRARRA